MGLRERYVGLEIRGAARWDQLVAQLAPAFIDPAPGPFEQPQVVVSSRGAGRVLRGQLAAALPGGICAGIGFVTLNDWLEAQAKVHHLAEDLAAWRSTRATVLAAGALEELSEEHRILQAHLSTTRSPRRRLNLASRSIRLFNRYVDHAPRMVSSWLDGVDVDVDGLELPHHLMWQPALLRLTAELLEVDPVETWESLAAAVEQSPPPDSTHLFALAEVPTSQAQVLGAAARSGEVTLWQVAGSPFSDWAAQVMPGGATRQGPAAAPSKVEVHGSHDPARQAEVLREVLTARFEADPDLEPRDVLIVCDDPRSWLPHLQTVFCPVDQPDGHPGRRLRLGAGDQSDTNHVLGVILRCLRLGQSRATATELTELLLLGPVAHRWRFDQRREDLTGLVEAAGIRWGLDGQHRAQLGLPGITQNTWFRGVDRLLAGLALAPDTTDAVPLTGVATVGTSDLELVGALGEVVSRLRMFNHHAQSPASGAVWVERIRGLLADLVRCPWADQWMETQANTALTGLAEELGDDEPPLTRSEFTTLFEQATTEFPARPGFGNGSMHVVGPGELLHVDHRLVCLLGITDAGGPGTVDSVELGPDVPEPRRRRLNQLLAHARACDHLVVVFQARDPQSNQEVPTPTAITWLLDEIGHGSFRTRQHPLLSFSEANFTEGENFDARSFAGARKLREVDAPAHSHVERRRRALNLPDGPGPSVIGLRELERFLKDPAKEFLRSATEVQLWESPQLRDELPFVPDGLERWQLQDRLLVSFQEGLTPKQAERREVEREQLPPGRTGKEFITAQLEEAKALWMEAFPDWSGDVEDHHPSVEVGSVLVSDAVRTRGGQIVHVTASKGRSTEVRPWLEQLLLAAAGTPAPVRVHRRVDRWANRAGSPVTLPPPEVERARQVLGDIVEAHRQGRTRLIPLPQDLGLALCEQHLGRGFTPGKWEVPSSNWKETLWSRPSEYWELFYSGLPSELFADAATNRDPEPPDGHPSAFAAWAIAIYGDLVRGDRR